jgi:hypothetical protein
VTEQEHTAAHRRLRREARARGCYVVCTPETVLTRPRQKVRMDRYAVINAATGMEYGAIRVPAKALTVAAVDEFFTRKAAPCLIR